MNEEDKLAKKKAAQAAAHKKWRESEKGKAYYLRQKLKQAGVDVVEIQAGEVSVK
jgi:TRAP-type C4-dicarboxylate transport system substrate-binding protein